MKLKALRAITISMLLCAAHTGMAQEDCIAENTWYIPATQQTTTLHAVVDDMKDKQFILIGEHHTDESHHRWHVEMLQALIKQYPRLVIGLEMLPRISQPVLDQWSEGKISDSEFEQRSDWQNIWGYDINLYLPTMKFARANKIPLKALNASRELLGKVRANGWQHIPAQEREQFTDPAKPTRDYVQQLAVSFRKHRLPDADQQAEQLAFLRFVEQQLLWDRAMADSLFEASQQLPEHKIIAFIGSWHLINQHGVPFQLRSITDNGIATLIPWSEHLQCTDLTDNFSSFIFNPAHSQ